MRLLAVTLVMQEILQTQHAAPEADDFHAITGKIGYYAIRILAELEDGPKDLVTKEPRIEMQHEIGGPNKKTFTNAVNKLQEKNLIEADDHKTETVFGPSETGKEYIEFLKQHYDQLDIKEPPERLRKGTSYKILDLIENATEGDPERISRFTEMYSFSDYVASELGVSKDAANKRIFELVKVKKYLKTILVCDENSGENGKGSAEIAIGASITPEGLDYLERVRFATRDKSLLDEDLVWETNIAFMVCQNLANELGDEESNSIIDAYQHRHFSEMTHEEFENASNAVFSLLDRLQQQKDQPKKQLSIS